MSRAGYVHVAPFLNGLNTETSAIANAMSTTTDELNCTIWNGDIRGRRYGMNVERDGVFFAAEPTTVYKDFSWKNVAKTDADFIVKQVGSMLHFYNAQAKPLSNYKIEGEIDLTPYFTEVGRALQNPCNFSSGDGYLLCVNKYIKPLRISYDFSTSEFKVEEVHLKYRDMDGLEDGVRLDETPAEITDEHFYNLLNQGWDRAQIELFKTERGFYPSNSMQWYVGKDNSGNFDTEQLLKEYFGNTPAPKGHYILDYFNKDRSAQSGITGGDARKVSYSYAKNWIDDRSFEFIPITESSAVFPNSEGTAKTCIVRITRLETKVDKRAAANLRGNVDYFLEGLDESVNEWKILSQQRDFHYTSSTSEPTIITMSFPDNTVKYPQYRVRIVTKDAENKIDAKYPESASGITFTAELAIAEDGDPFAVEQSLDRITDVSFMSGKYFYAVKDTVLFSQTITEDSALFAKCYQSADPTSENISDLVSTDGGVVKFETMGDCLALRSFNRGILVFGRDSVQGIIAPADGRFSATAYDIVELSNTGLVGANTVVSTSDSVFFWSPLGIFRIGVNQQTGSSLLSDNVSLLRIQSFYNKIDKFSKEFCKGVYDYSNNRIMWYYPTDPTRTHVLDSCLVYDVTRDAFMPYKVDGTEGAIVSVMESIESYAIEPTEFVKVAGIPVESNEEYITATEESTQYNTYTSVQHGIINKEGGVSFGDYNNRDMLDWDKVSYDSYLVSAPITLTVGGSVNTFSDRQTPKVSTIFERTEKGELLNDQFISPSGCYMRMRWGWSLDEGSNKWDMVQNSYIPHKGFMSDDVVLSKVRVRGRGKAFQIEYRNDGDKDFRILGTNLEIRSQ